MFPFLWVSFLSLANFLQCTMNSFCGTAFSLQFSIFSNILVLGAALCTAAFLKFLPN